MRVPEAEWVRSARGGGDCGRNGALCTPGRDFDTVPYIRLTLTTDAVTAMSDRAVLFFAAPQRRGVVVISPHTVWSVAPS